MQCAGWAGLGGLATNSPVLWQSARSFVPGNQPLEFYHSPKHPAWAHSRLAGHV